MSVIKRTGASEQGGGAQIREGKGTVQTSTCTQEEEKDNYMPKIAPTYIDYAL